MEVKCLDILNYTRTDCFSGFGIKPPVCSIPVHLRVSAVFPSCPDVDRRRAEVKTCGVHLLREGSFTSAYILNLSLRRAVGAADILYQAVQLFKLTIID